MAYYARVSTMTGEFTHLAEVKTRNRPFSIEGLKTLCGRQVGSSMEGCSDKCTCGPCLKQEQGRVLPRSSWEDPTDYFPKGRRRG